MSLSKPHTSLCKSHKKFSEGKQAHVGMEALKTNRTRWESMTPQHFHTIPTSCAILPAQFQYAMCLLVVCREGLWKAVGSVVVGVWCILMCMESELCCGLLECSCYTEHGRFGVLTVCRNCVVHEQCWVCMVCGV